MKIFQGIDLIKIKRVSEIYLKFKNKFLHKIFTINEINQIEENKKNMELRIAGKYASKEAACTAFGISVPSATTET